MDINWALLASYLVAIIIEIGLPVFAAVWLLRKYKTSWVLLVTGVLTFLVSQAIHIPALNGISTLFNNGTIPTPSAQWIPYLNALIVGLLAGICEESMRWIGFKINEKRSKPFRSALALGIGHGGIESIIVAGLVAFNLGTVLFYNAGAQIANGASTTTVQSILAQIAQYWATPWYIALAGALERIISLSSQIVLSIMVWKAVVKHAPLWFLLALLYHTVIDGVSTYLSGIGWSTWQIEGALTLFMLLNVLLIYNFWNDEGGVDSEGDEDDDDEDDEDDDDEDDDEEGEDEEATEVDEEEK